MSFREIRAFVESMRALGYPRLISLESFRTPNFRLVADTLFWLTLRYDSSAEIPDDIDTDDARVEFLKAVAQAIYSKARIKLNIKQLYRADGYAVKELLKISMMLYEAMQAGEEDSSDATKADDPNAPKPLTATEIAKRLEELKSAREIAKDIVDCGERLVTCLLKEESIRPARDQALQLLGQLGEGVGANGAGSAEVAGLVRTELAGKLDVLRQRVAEEQRSVDALSKEEQTLQQKVANKDSEYERHSKRANDMRRIRPAYMDEYEHFERELKVAYEVYVEKFRNLQHLESALSQINEQEANTRKEANKQLRKMQKKIRADELQLLRGESGGRPGMEDLDDEDDDDIIRDDDDGDDGLDGLDMDDVQAPEDGNYGVALRGATGANRFSQPSFFGGSSHADPDSPPQQLSQPQSQTQPALARPSDSARRTRPGNALAPLASDSGMNHSSARRLMGSMDAGDDDEDEDEGGDGMGFGARPNEALGGSRPAAARAGLGSASSSGSGRIGATNPFGSRSSGLEQDDDDDEPKYSGF